MWNCVCVFAIFAREREKDATRTDTLGNLVKTKNNPNEESEHHMTIIESDLMLKTLRQQKKKPYKYTGPKICNNDETIVKFQFMLLLLLYSCFNKSRVS